MDDPLFSRADLGESIRATARALIDSVTSWNPDDLLATPPADVVDRLVEKHSIGCPLPRREEAALRPVTEVTERFQAGDLGPGERRRTSLTLDVPYDGEREIFNMRASTYTHNPPYATVTDEFVSVTWIGDNADALRVRSFFDDRLNSIEQQLAWSRADIARHNQQIRADAPRLVEERRQKLLADRHVEAALGFPVRRRPDASKYAVPVNRRRVTPHRPAQLRAAPAFKPEPVLADADYEAALAVLRNARNALERSPSMTAGLSEEHIRDLLLVNLNAHFEGQAGGELFNGAGKTDILIRVEDRNIFIGECKIWKGPKGVRSALDQLLGYLVWRDTKAALLLFIRRADVTDVIAKTVAEIEAHPNYKRTASRQGDGERYDFALHAAGDPQREIRLAFLPFALGSASA